GRQRMAKLLEMTEQKLASFDDLAKQRLIAKRGVKSIDEIPKAEVQAAIKSKEFITPEEFERSKVYAKRKDLYTRSGLRYDPKAYSVKDGGDAETFILPVGNLKTPGEKVTPGVLNAVYIYDRPAHAEVAPATAGRRLALANWVANPQNP